ncbi:unnamed protein product [Blepharisma stoltei]|uniref:Uncharacterized protein n=1 Tax=Blepharisma stoltei TaxID=1481888 RepID=A0AAU9JBE9_9CILI|nr:unnamed protein product [Blepharisma stoltei]
MALNQSYFSRPGRSSSKTLKILKGGYLSLMASHEMLKGKGITISELNKISEKSTTKDPKKVAVIDEIYNPR